MAKTNKKHLPNACPNVVFTTVITLRNGRILHAHECGKTVFAFCGCSGKKKK